MTNSNPTSAEALIAALHEPGREHLLDLVRNPLRLTLLCMTWDGSSLPETQAELYDRYLRKIYGWNQNWHELENHAERCGTTTTKLKQNLNQQLGELAKAALNLPQERFRLSQALVEKYLGEELDKTSLGYLALRLGWLNRVGRDGRGDAIFAFYHATFQEYFAALAVEDWDYFLPRNHVNCPVEGKRYRIFEPQWKQVILLWLGREDFVEEKDNFIEKLVNFEDKVCNFYWYKSIFLAVYLLAELRNEKVKVNIASRIIGFCIGFCLKNHDQYAVVPIIINKSRFLIKNNSNHNFIINLIAQVIDNVNSKKLSYQKKYLFAKLFSELNLHCVSLPNSITSYLRLFLEESNDIDICYKLAKAESIKETALAKLENHINTLENENLIHDAAYRLASLDNTNLTAKNILVNLANNAKEKYIRRLAAESLIILDDKLSLAIQSLTNLIDISPKNIESAYAAYTLLKYGHGDLLTISFLFQASKASTRVIEMLGDLAQSNTIYFKSIITNLVNLCQFAEDVWIRLESSFQLGLIMPNKSLPINVLVEIVEKNDDLHIKWEAAAALGIIVAEHLTAIDTLLELAKTISGDYFLRQKIMGTFSMIQPGSWLKSVVSIYKTAEYQFNDYGNIVVNIDKYNLFWNCAENLPYPEFYQAWHHPPTTPHPEVEDNTPVTSTPFTQQCNLALLPQILNQALQTHPVNCQIICIDGSRFSDPSNPALQIYTALKKAGCPPSPDGKPRTIAELQAYCDDDLSDHQIALILYEEPTDPPPQGFDIAVLNQLARFSHPPIAVIVPQPLPECRLPQFLESDPNLVTTILQWLQNLER